MNESKLEYKINNEHKVLTNTQEVQDSGQTILSDNSNLIMPNLFNLNPRFLKQPMPNCVVSLHTELINVRGVQECTYTQSTGEYTEYEKCTRSTGL